MRACSVCGGDAVDRGGPHRVYCSDLCRWEDRPDLVCPGCGTVFRSKDRKAIYCSQRCREAGHRAPRLEAARQRRLAIAEARERRIVERASERAVALAPRPCRGCEIVFRPQRRTGVFHDADCRESFYRRTNERERRRRAKIVSRRLRVAVYARDRARCYLCRQEIDMTIAFPDPRSPSVDHVMPYSAGGSDALDNLRAAHLGCNMEKSDRLPYWWERRPA